MNRFLKLVLFFCLCSCTNINKADYLFEYSNQNRFESCVVEYVVDGDTVEVSTENDIIRVRLIGVDTPESVNWDESKNCDEGIIASNFTKDVLYSGREVFLEYDIDKEDDYGRTLAYIWLSEGVDTTNFNDFKEYNFGAILLQNTYCRATYYAPNDKYRFWLNELDRGYKW